jgi:3-phosphoshikimate 1-carboxyvinyltransferase
MSNSASAKATIHPGRIAGEISAIPSKSHLHRQLIYSALADGDTFIKCPNTEAEDITATTACLSALGAVINRTENGFNVTPADRNNLPAEAVFPCGESGSTLRFMLPVVCALGIRGTFEMKGRLPERPLTPLITQLKKHGIKVWNDNEILNVGGRLTASKSYIQPGDISSQYISGLMMALPLLDKPSRIIILPPVESADYIEMTISTAKEFGYNVNSLNNGNDFTEYEITSGIYKSPVHAETEGDWSNSAFWLCAGAMAGGDVKISGLRKGSKQGDRYIYDILSMIDADISRENELIHVREGRRRFSEIDARSIPDLIPILAAVASVGEGTVVFKNAARLRLKESDRLKATAETLSAIGANIKETDDGLIVEGVKSLKGGCVDSFGDHRIAMMAAIASTACENPLVIENAQAVNKSYPRFWEDLRLMGKEVTVS